ncbi:MAG TPA: selenium cofactor biosynthesis protein YqeC [Dehalococcoidia bacterium]|nr:selenium cofactor biosynthesis protein YqeC [Dehalococcoidia bacterium]
MDLIDALALRQFDCIAIVGGGGKTAIMYRLGSEAAARGWPAIVGGTTRFTSPRAGTMPQPVLVAADSSPGSMVEEALHAAQVVTVTAGRGDKGRWLPVSPAQIDALARAQLGLIAIEADGSRNRPFKAPGDGEPVIPSRTTAVLSVVGLDAIGRPLVDEWVHRPKQVAALTGVGIGEPVTPELIAAVLLHAQGGRKCVPAGARWIPVLNKADTPERLAAGRDLAALLLRGGADRVVLAAAAQEPPVVEVLAPT